jgi:hypothetical protein
MRASRKWLALATGALFVALSAGSVAVWRGWGTGKTTENASPPLPLLFRQTSLSLGTVRSNSHLGSTARTCLFPFRVWDQGPVTITNITADCCGSLHFEQDLIGRELAPRSEHVLKATIDIPPSAGPLRVKALLELTPGPRTIVLELSADMVGLPAPAPNRVEMETTFGIQPRQDLHFSCLRTQSAPSLDLLADGSSTPGFRIVHRNTRLARRISRPEQYRPPVLDEIDLVLQGTQELPVGTHRSEWAFKWANKVPDTVVPVTVIVRPPVYPRLDSVFCGELVPRQDWKLRVPLVRRPDTTIRLKEVRSSKSFLQAQLSRNNLDQLEVSLSAPETLGRFEGVVELVFDDSRLQPVRLPVSGIVVKK